jgi:lysophospholipase L1-like esterase
MRNKMAQLALTGSVLAAAALLVLPATTTAAGAGTTSSPSYYVSIGDSYAIGYQPDPAVSLRFGYTRGVISAERKRGTNLTLANFGCGGATTTSLLTTVGCPDPAPPALNGVPYPTVPQATAATAFIAAHRGHVALITISIGGNDVTKCALSPNPTACVVSAVPAVAANVATLLVQVRAAAGNTVPIVGLTYPDVILGAWVHPPVSKSLASLSVAAFRLALNPMLKTAYGANGGTFVDVTRATGAYTPLTKTTVFRPYGRIPVAVALACTYTWYCAKGDIHLHTVGYQLIANLIVAALPTRLR